MSDVSKHIETLSPKKRALLELLISETKKGRQAPQSSKPTRRQQRDLVPLSFTQQRLWFLDQLEPGSAAYNIPLALKLTGPLQLPALKQTLTEVVRRHEVLRTCFVEVQGEPRQLILDAVAVRVPVIDLSGIGAESQQRELTGVSEAEARGGFELSRGPLLRVKLLRLGAEEHVAVVVLHHIISDGWSMGVLVREVATLYEAYCTGADSPLSELAIQYGDYAVWQREWLSGAVLAEQLEYWRAQLGGDLAVLELPTDRVRPTVQSYRGQAEPFRLPLSLSKALEELSRREGVTMYMVLLGGFEVLLHRYSGQEEVMVGTPVANRSEERTEELIGCFVNTLALRLEVGGNPTFREVLRRVRAMALGAYAHQDLPFEMLVEHLQPQRNLSRTPLFQVFFNLSQFPNSEIKLQGLTLESLPIYDVQSKFDLTLYTIKQDTGIEFILVYNTDLFDRARIVEMLEQFQRLLEQIVVAPEKHISNYSLVTEKSRSLLPDPGVPLNEPPFEPFISTFQEWVKRIPAHPAVCQGERLWTYSELSKSSRILAQTLCHDGLARGDVVAVMGPPSFGLIASMMAVLWSGGVLLTVDQNLPSQRQRLMLTEAGARRLLYIGDWKIGDEWIHELPSLFIRQVDADEGRAAGAEEVSSMSRLKLTEPCPDDPAYIFFTSGTTGIPKGILGSHKGLSHFLDWQRKTFAITPTDRCAHLTGLSFDVVLRDVFLPLVSGASLHLPETPRRAEPDQIISWLDHSRITVIHTVPALAQSWLVNHPTEIVVRSLRWVFFAGEPLTDRLVQQWRAVFPELDGVVNLYGPTETTLAKCFYIVPANPAPGVQPVGWPLPQTQALVLGQEGELCSVGELGEIVLRTPFRSLGYINNTNQARNSFIKNHFREDDKDLLYFTGDRGRYRPDGTLQIHGRLDDQIKIRGVRVEPGEVTAILSQHPTVQSCVVVAHDDEDGQVSLAAYVVASPSGSETVAELRTYLSQHLSPVMIPNYIVPIAEIPLTGNGKVDRRALPGPEQRRVGHSQRGGGDRGAGGQAVELSSTEEIVSGIWSEVLGVSEVSRSDNFFDLGGHSLSATQVISRLRAVFEQDLPLTVMFEHPVLSELSGEIEQQTRAGARAWMAALKKVEREGEVAVSYAQQRLWFLDQLEPGSAAYNIPTAVRLTGLLNLHALELTFTEIVRRHEVLRTSFVSHQGEPVQVVAPPLPMRVPVIDLSGRGERERQAEVERLSREEAEEPFELSRGPLLRVKLLRLAEEEHILLLTMHHIISDGWSMGVLVREVATLYEAYGAGEDSPLSELAIQYGDYAVWQRRWLSGAVLAEQVEYWRAQLGGELAVLELPTDRVRPAVQRYRGGVVERLLDVGLTRQVKELSRREGVTMYMVLLGGFEVLLHRYTGQEEIIVGTDVANRGRQEIEALIGFFINQLVLRIEVGGNPTFREVLRRVRAMALGAYAHQDLPFEMLVEELNPRRDSGRAPLFQVKLVWQNAQKGSLQLPGLELSTLSTERITAKFDLTLTLTQQPDKIACACEYSTDLFEASSIKAMLDQYEKLLSTVVDQPSLRLDELKSLLDEAEKERQLREEQEIKSAFLKRLSSGKRKSKRISLD
jgi:amino acid adenylation domain-containing protein